MTEVKVPRRFILDTNYQAHYCMVLIDASYFTYLRVSTWNHGGALAIL